jgi:ethanolamine utilization protein EutQ (cupin superfamily)
MAHLIAAPTSIQAAGAPPKRISEFVGRLNTRTEAISLAVMESPAGWEEPGQTPDFDEYTIVMDGELTIETRHETLTINAGQAAHAPAREWVRYSTPSPNGARYVSVCLPAFSAQTVNRDPES